MKLKNTWELKKKKVKTCIDHEMVPAVLVGLASKHKTNMQSKYIYLAKDGLRETAA